VRVSASAAGQRVRCPRCQADFKVPGTTPPVNDDDDDWLNLDEPLPASLAAAKPPSASKPDPSKSDAAKPTAASLPVDLEDDYGFQLVPDDPGSDSQANRDDDLFGMSLPAPPADSGKATGDFSADDLAALENILGASSPKNHADNFSGQAGGPAMAGGAPLGEVLGDEDVVSEFRVTCSICSSVTYARPDQVGKQIKCHDCYSPITVPPPPKPKKVYKPDIENAQVFGMFETPEPPPSFNAPNVKSAEQLLREAEAADDAEEHNYENPDVKNWLIGIFRIFLDPQVAVHWLLLATLGSVLGCVSVVLTHVGALIPLFAITAFFWAFVFACGFSIMESVSNNAKRVSEWPYMDPSEWFGQMATVVSAAMLCVGPPLLLALFVLGLSPLSVMMMMFALFLLFPFVLMSMLDSGSVFVPFSAEVTKSVTRCQEQWGVLYLSSGLLFVGMFVFYLICFFLPPIAAVVFVNFATVAALFTYFSMLGRLAYAIGYAVNAPPLVD